MKKKNTTKAVILQNTKVLKTLQWIRLNYCVKWVTLTLFTLNISLHAQQSKRAILQMQTSFATHVFFYMNMNTISKVHSICSFMCPAIDGLLWQISPYLWDMWQMAKCTVSFRFGVSYVQYNVYFHRNTIHIFCCCLIKFHPPQFAWVIFILVYIFYRIAYDFKKMILIYHRWYLHMGYAHFPKTYHIRMEHFRFSDDENLSICKIYKMFVVNYENTIHIYRMTNVSI